MARERIDIRVEPEILEELEEIARLDNANSRSAAVREAIYSYVDDRKETWNSGLVKVAIPRRLLERAEKYIRAGEVKDLDSAISDALKDWCRALDNYYMNDENKINSILSEKMVDNIARTEAEGKGRKIARR